MEHEACDKNLDEHIEALLQTISGEGGHCQHTYEALLEVANFLQQVNDYVVYTPNRHIDYWLALSLR